MNSRVAVFEAIAVLVKLHFQAFERADVVHLFQLFSKLFDDVNAQVSDLLRANEFKQLDDGRVQQVVPAVVRLQCLHNRCEQVAADNVPVVEVVLQTNDFSEESQ